MQCGYFAPGKAVKSDVSLDHSTDLKWLLTFEMAFDIDIGYEIFNLRHSLTSLTLLCVSCYLICDTCNKEYAHRNEQLC